MPPKGKAKGAAKKTTASAEAAAQKKKEAGEKKETEKRDVPLYLQTGHTQKDKDVVLDGIYMYTPTGKTELLRNASLRLVYGRHYGLIGQNGIGKSTLLRHISEYKLQDFPQYLRVVHVHQEEIPHNDMDIKVLDFVVKSDEQKNYLESEEERLLSEMEKSGDNNDNADDDVDAHFQELQDKLDLVYQRLEVTFFFSIACASFSFVV